MTITPKGTRNYAESIFDGRTGYSRNRAITNRTFDINEVINEMSKRKHPAYVVGDEIKLADGTTRNVRFRTYSPSQGTWVYRLNTEKLNRYGGTLSTGNLTEQQVLTMDVSRKPSLKVSEADGWIVQFKTTSESSEFRTWTNDGGEVAIFEKELAVYFAQGMVMAHDQQKQWAIFRVRPFEGYTGEQYFTTLIQPDGQYTAAIAHRALYDGGNWSLLDADDEILANYHHSDVGHRFIQYAVCGWNNETRDYSEVTIYRNPYLPVFEAGIILTLPTGFNRPVQFVTPYWIKAGQVGFRYWFYLQDKQLVSYTESEITLTDLDKLFDSAFEKGNAYKAVFDCVEASMLYVGGTIFVDENGDAIDAIDTDEQPCAEMQEEIDSRDSRIKELEDKLLRAERKLKLIQHKEVQYENQRKNFKIAWSALRQNAPHICKEIEPHLLETVEYDKMCSPILVENLEKEGAIIHLKDVLLDIRECAENMSTDAGDEWGWLSYMATMGLQGGHYNRDTMLPRFGIGEFPKHTLPITDEI